MVRNEVNAAFETGRTLIGPECALPLACPLPRFQGVRPIFGDKMRSRKETLSPPKIASDPSGVNGYLPNVQAIPETVQRWSRRF